MSSTLCEQFEDWLAGQSGALESSSAAGHLDACLRCRSLADDLDAIRAAGHQWGLEQPAPPPRLWTAIESRLQAEGLIVDPVPASRWFSGWRLPTPQWALSGAYLCLALIASGLASYQAVPSGDSSGVMALMDGSSSLADLGQRLDGSLQDVVASFPQQEDNDSVMMSLRHNMGIVDNLIAVCEKSVREHPGDPLAREYLYGAYQQKADLLAAAIDRRTLEIQ
jgi:hypothetical protein